MNIRHRVGLAFVAHVSWIASWALISGGMAIGAAGEPNPAYAGRVIGYGAASSVVFGLLAFLGWGKRIPLALRGALYGVIASLPLLLGAAVAFLLGKAMSLDWWTLVAAPMLSGLFGYLLRETLAD